MCGKTEWDATARPKAGGHVHVCSSATFSVKRHSLEYCSVEVVGVIVGRQANVSLEVGAFFACWSWPEKKEEEEKGEDGKEQRNNRVFTVKFGKILHSLRNQKHLHAGSKNSLSLGWESPN